MAGPAYCAVATPVSTKMPVPMMAPIPSVIRFVAPSARRRLCSPVSPASFRISLSGLVASRLPIRLSFLWLFEFREAHMFFSRLTRGLSRRARDRCGLSLLHAAMPDAVEEIDKQADHQPAHQSRPVGPTQAVDHGATHDDSEGGHHRNCRHSESPLQLGAAHAQD